MGIETALLVGGGLLGAGASIHSANKAAGAAREEGARVDALEAQRFEEAKRQAEQLRQQGNEAAAQALEEATRADLGAEKFQTLMNDYAARAEQGAARIEQAGMNIYQRTQDAAQQREDYALNVYQRIQDAARAKEAAGLDSQAAIQAATREVQQAAGLNEQQLNSALQSATSTMNRAFGNIESRYSPFMESERKAIGQLGVEMGLTQGDQYTGYRDTPAYAAAQDASRVAEREGIAAVNQSAGNTGTLYSGTRGAALLDRAQQGSYERAGIEQSYYQNYMNMLQGMANPVSTSAVSNLEAQNARDIGQMGMNTANTIAQGRASAAQTGLSGAVAAENARLGSMRIGAEGSDLIGYAKTGMEGAELMNYLNPGTAGAQYAIAGFNPGTAGSNLRMAAQDYRLNSAANAAGLVTGNMPTGALGGQYRMAGTEAKNAAIADLIGGATNIYSAYLQNR